MGLVWGEVKSVDKNRGQTLNHTWKNLESDRAFRHYLKKIVFLDPAHRVPYGVDTLSLKEA